MSDIRWFGFPKKPDVKTERSPVAPDDRAKAIENLRAIGRVNLDHYLEEIDPQKLLNSSVGSTAECVTLDELDQYSQIDFKLGSVPAHISQCHYCSDAVRAYRAAKIRALKPESKVKSTVWLQALGPVSLKFNSVEFDLVLQCQNALTSLKSQDVTVEGLDNIFENVKCHNVFLVDSDELVGRTYRARFIAKPSHKLIGELDPGSDFCDWVRVTGFTDSGVKFTASDLMCFRRELDD